MDERFWESRKRFWELRKDLWADEKELWEMSKRIWGVERRKTAGLDAIEMTKEVLRRIKSILEEGI